VAARIPVSQLAAFRCVASVAISRSFSFGFLAGPRHTTKTSRRGQLANDREMIALHAVQGRRRFARSFEPGRTEPAVA
jgi:hypothetical protein